MTMSKIFVARLTSINGQWLVVSGQSAPPVQFPIIRERFKRVYHRHLSDAFSIAAGAPKYFFRRSESNFERRSYV